MATNNGVNLQDINDYVEAVKDDKNKAQVQFVAQSKWAGGTASKITCTEFLVDGQPGSDAKRHFSFDMDEPAALGGNDSAPNPVEYLAAALCGCLTAGIATNSALFGNELEKIDIEVKVDFDMQGVLGIDRSVPSSAAKLHYKVKLKGADKAGTLRSKETIDRKSAIKNTLQLPLEITTEVEIED
ncbi:MAG: OsmC family peroxiredoxin [Sphingobacteriaceae bacterium]|nr:MAG: OsmC family peroxiredoxin [Sphingobacteriaceae bacterium]